LKVSKNIMAKDKVIKVIIGTTVITVADIYLNRKLVNTKKYLDVRQHK
jgi:hypothetical protein